MQAQATVQNRFINSIRQGDCIPVMREMPANSADFILTDPPYLVNYRDRDGRTIKNDANVDWLKPAMHEAYRVLKQNRVAVMFYGWTKVDIFRPSAVSSYRFTGCGGVEPRRGSSIP